MEKIIGYQWYINCGGEEYMPTETTFSTLNDVYASIKDYNLPETACGIMKVENEEGCITILETIKTPTTTYYEDSEDY